jgi:type VI secretion system secreted protein Hcp
MAIDYFLQITGVEGESVDAKHKGFIDVDSWSWGEAQSAGAHPAGGGGGAGKVAFQDFHFVSRVSKASPTLFLACASGQHLKEAKLVARKAGGKGQQEFLTWTFSDLLVSSYQTGGSEAADTPMDQVSLNFAKVKVEYKAQKADGTLDAPITAGWDITKNTKV